MSDFGITTQGFIRKTRNDIVASLTDKYKTKVDPDIDLSIYSPDGMRMQLEADALDELWQVAEAMYYSMFIDTAIGASLDRVVGLGGQKRSPAKRAIVPLTFGGVDDSSVDVGTICETAQGIQFITIESGIVASGIIIVQAQSIQFGTDGNVPSDTITNIKTPLPGISTVNNADPASGGRIIEADFELRDRYKSRGTSGGSSAVAIQTLLNDLTDVLTALVYENATPFTDADGRPPNSMQAVIDGGNPTDIANLFLNNWPGGIESIGAQSVSIVDNKGIPRTYYYDLPEDLNIYVAVTIQKGSAWIDGSEIIVKTNIIKVFGGIDTVGGVDTKYSGNGIGADVLAWEAIAAQAGLTDYDTAKVSGIDKMTVLVGTTATPTADQVAVSGTQRAKCITANIGVTFI